MMSIGLIYRCFRVVKLYAPGKASLGEQAKLRDEELIELLTRAWLLDLRSTKADGASIILGNGGVRTNLLRGEMHSGKGV
jgi:hypothetical protein